MKILFILDDEYVWKNLRNFQGNRTLITDLVSSNIFLQIFKT